MRNVLRREMFGDYELSLIEITHPTMPSMRAIDYDVRICMASGGFTRPVRDMSHGFADEEAAWSAGLKYIESVKGKLP